MSERAELEKQAQEKLAQAQRLIDEAGQLAKQGQFVLHFGEIGTFIPKKYNDPAIYRDEAIELLKEEGWNQFDQSKGDYVKTTWAELENDPERMEEAISDVSDSLITNSNVPWEYREYDGGEGVDAWWHPSRC